MRWRSVHVSHSKLCKSFEFDQNAFRPWAIFCIHPTIRNQSRTLRIRKLVQVKTISAENRVDLKNELLFRVTNDFVACIGDSSHSCLSVQNLMHNGLDYDDATVYVTIAAEMRYECGPAYEGVESKIRTWLFTNSYSAASCFATTYCCFYNLVSVIVDHFDCAWADSISKIDQINYCIQQFNNSIYSDPTKLCQ